jgi:NADPH:quinone reductase-like Zn-dependent oxidoreductase
MHAVVIHRHGGPEVLEPAEIDKPEPGTGEALVRVAAVSVNAFLDVSNRAGKVPFARYTFPHVLGSEHAGTLLTYGPDTTGPIPPGTAVVVRNTVFCHHCDMCQTGRLEACRTLGIIGVTRPGAYAEYTTVPIDTLRALPAGCDPVQATAMATNGPLAHAQLRVAGLDDTRTVLIQGAGSAAGSMAAVLARALGKTVLGTVRGPARAATVDALALYDHIIDSTAPDATDHIRDHTNGTGVDVILDNLGVPALWDLDLQVLAPGGRIITSGAKFGGTIQIDIATLYTRSQHIIGLRSASAQDHDAFWQLVATHGLRPVIDSIHPLDDAAQAHRRIESGHNTGRVVLTVGGAAASA